MARLALVATPIGNLEDVTLRALRALREARLVLAEDTRRTRVLLARHEISAQPRSLHAHNEAARIDEVLAALRAGGDVALVSDAGTPLISDPGERLVAAVLAAGYEVTPLPGASALLAALGVAGLPLAEGFTFVGFPPRKAGARAAQLRALSERGETLVFFESPRRLPALLAALVEHFGPRRRACVARELTKLHEEVVRDTLAELASRFADGTRGEVCVVVEGAPPAEIDPAALDQAIRDALASGASARDAAAAVAASHGARRSAVYRRLLEIAGR